MKYGLLFMAMAPMGLTLVSGSMPVRADQQVVTYSYERADNPSVGSAMPYDGRGEDSIDGTLVRVDPDNNRLTIITDQDRVYHIDTNNSEIMLSRHREGQPLDLMPGQHVHIFGKIVGRGFVVADQVRVLPRMAYNAGERMENGYQIGEESTPQADAPNPTAPVLSAPVDQTPDPVLAPPAPAHVENTFLMDGILSRVDTDGGSAVLQGDDGKSYTMSIRDADFILMGAERAGSLGDLTHGMRVHVVGTLLADGSIEIDRIREIPATTDLDAAPSAQPAASPAPAPAPVVQNLDSYTGILIDCSQLPDIMRSPSPAIYGPEPDEQLLYPDRSHVPTPDEVQDESIVRYYHTLADAQAGVCGSNPLILPADAVVGPAHDGVVLSGDNASLFQKLDDKLHYLRTWKVGFLIPQNQ